MHKLGIVGWRGMVGRVLLERMLAENDFDNTQPTLFSTSQAGQQPPDIGLTLPPLADAWDVTELAGMDIIISCQGGDYTRNMQSRLRDHGWQGYWIDAASALRMDPDSVIVLDPINRRHIDRALEKGVKNYIGGNCTVSLMMLAIAGLLKHNLVEWVSAMTYQAISGSGAKAMQELIAQMNELGPAASDPDILTAERHMRERSYAQDFPDDTIGHTLAMNVLPWIDSPMPNGQTREEWKAQAEMNKILQRRQRPIPVDGICVRIGTLRSHSQALTLKLKEDLSVEAIQELLTHQAPWVSLIENSKEATFNSLTPVDVSGKMDIAVGRIKKTGISKRHINLFTVGDQLLWGAAEPLRRVLRIIMSRG